MGDMEMVLNGHKEDSHRAQRLVVWHDQNCCTVGFQCITLSLQKHQEMDLYQYSVSSS